MLKPKVAKFSKYPYVQNTNANENNLHELKQLQTANNSQESLVKFKIRPYCKAD